MYARDGVTILDDPNEFGQQWQVLESEPMLFHSVEGVQHPTECAMPDPNLSEKKRRRLGESAISPEEAVQACTHVGELEFDACIFDVLATNDKGIARAY